MCRFESANDCFKKICASIIEMVDRAQEALSCGLLPKAHHQGTGSDEDGSEQTRAVFHFDHLAMRTGIFVGRKELLDQMQDNLLSGDPGDRKEIVYLLGMGGVGKTQLALEYTQRNLTSYKDVFWVSIANEETAGLGFRSIYQRL